MTSVRFLIAILAFAGITGCASAPPTPTFDPADSKALNIMKAAGMSAKLEDVKVPKDTITSITDAKGYGFAMAASGYASPLSGFTAGQMAGLNLASWLLAPTADTARVSFFAWMPENIGGDKPDDKMAEILLEAGKKAVKEMGYEPLPDIADGGKDKSGIGIYFRNGDGNVCRDINQGSNCWITFATRDPIKLTNAKSFVNESSNVWFFDPSANVYSHYIFSRENTGLNELDVLVKVSKYAPPWVYFYVAPNKVKLNEKDMVKIPLLLNQGNILYFIKPNT